MKNRRRVHYCTEVWGTQGSYQHASVLTTPVCIDKVDNNLAVESPVERPNKQIRQQHQKTDDQPADNKHVAENQVKGKELCLHPTPDAIHCCRVPHLLSAYSQQHFLPVEQIQYV